MATRRVGRLAPAEVEAIREEMARATRGTHRAAGELYRRLQGLTPEQLQQVLASAVGEYERAAQREIADRALNAARLGAAAALRSIGESAGGGSGSGSGGDGPRPGGRPMSEFARDAGEWLRKRQERGGWTIAPRQSPRSHLAPSGDVRLSYALHGRGVNAAGLVASMGDAIRQAVEAGETAGATAQQIRDRIGHSVDIRAGGPRGYSVPEDLDTLAKSARRMFAAAGSPDAMREGAALRRRLTGWAERLTGGKATARETLDRIDRAIAKGRVAAVGRAVDWWVWHRERVHLEGIVEWETTRAWNNAYVEAAADNETVLGFEWHVDEDTACKRCLALAAGHSAGMPPGTYTREDILRILPPVHNWCHCWLTEVVDLRLV